ncbi:hypothetical protein ACRARG_05690 [Pseudooceanicola sp. C21-150M6]|uniref:hypothetical protein n=1 Tax=Pseudooceanicola sp. C21-150M6 TaxID=3434355 RepID=UPI003D7FB575
MIDEAEFNTRAETARKALAARFGGRPDTLREALNRAGRRLPARARAAGQEVLQAQARMSHPDLRLQVEEKPILDAFDRLMAGIETTAPGELRKTKLVGALASLAFNFILFGILALVVLRWRGLI